MNIFSVAFVTIFVVLFFGLCILVHEFGHFIAAKWRGLYIVAFSLGFKKVWAFTRGGVEYRIGMLPFGGYVDIPQLDASTEDSIKAPDGTVLPPASPIDRIIVAFSGPLFNIIFGLLIGIFLWIHGIPQDTPRLRSFEIAAVDQNSPEYRAGLRPGDILYEVNGKGFNSTWSEIVENLIFTIGDVTLSVRRDGEDIRITYTPAVNPNKAKSEEIAFPFFEPKIPVIIDPLENSPALRHGFKKNDTIIRVNGKEVRDIKDFLRKIDLSEGRPVDVTVRRDGEELEIRGIVPDKEKEKEKVFQVGVAYSPETPVVVTGVVEGFPAEAAGLKVGDEIVAIDGEKLDEEGKLQGIVSGSGGKNLVFSVRRGEEKLEIPITPRSPSLYTIGVGFVFYSHPDPFQQFVDVMVKTYKGLKGMFSKESNIGFRHMSGPAGIVRGIWIITYVSGFVMGLYFVTVISYSLAVFNLLPIPVLDGGHIVIACFEIVFRRKIPEAILKPVIYAFVILLIGLMFFVTVFNDFKGRRLFKGKTAIEEPAKPAQAPVKQDKP